MTSEASTPVSGPLRDSVMYPITVRELEVLRVCDVTSGAGWGALVADGTWRGTGRRRHR